MMIPEESLATDQGRPFVYVIKEDNKIEARPLKVGPQVGPNRVVREGLSASDRVAVTGLQRLRRDVEVLPKERLPAAKEATPAEVLAADKLPKSAKAAKVSAGHGAE